MNNEEKKREEAPQEGKADTPGKLTDEAKSKQAAEGRKMIDVHNKVNDVSSEEEKKDAENWRNEG